MKKKRINVNLNEKIDFNDFVQLNLFTKKKLNKIKQTESSFMNSEQKQQTRIVSFLIFFLIL
jgi:hypothetical protein